MKRIITIFSLSFSFLFNFNTSAQVQSNALFTVDAVLLQNIGSPWGMAFINSDTLLFTEKTGKLWRYRISTNTTTEITGLPTIVNHGQGGLLDIALHPDFATNNLVYLSYSINATGGQTTALGRGTLVNNQLQNFTELFRALPVVNSGVHFGSRIAFDHEKRLYLSVGDRGHQDYAQDLNTHMGSIIRLNDDGTVPADNPFVGVANTKPEIYSYGHRNIQGMVYDYQNNKLYAHEHGPRGGDELNVITKGGNYGWPAITYGINYDGTPITDKTEQEGMEQPITYWTPSIAPSGLTIIKRNTAGNQLQFLLGALAGQHLHYLHVENNAVISSSRSLQGYARIRDVRQAPNGFIYALTESPNRLVRLQATGLLSSPSGALHINSSILFPNPSEKTGTLKFFVPVQQNVEIKILSVSGEVMHTLTNHVPARRT
ncbi:MAG: PQQ-dependent sugar dehydrogenase [Cytophagaceae bacterium]